MIYYMTSGPCKIIINKEDSVGAGPQNMFVNLFLMAQSVGQSNTKCCLSSAEPEAQKIKPLWRCSKISIIDHPFIFFLLEFSSGS